MTKSAIPDTPLQSETESVGCSVEGVQIQLVGTVFEYTIPNFSCISFTLSLKPWLTIVSVCTTDSSVTIQAWISLCQ